MRNGIIFKSKTINFMENLNHVKLISWPWMVYYIDWGPIMGFSFHLGALTHWVALDEFCVGAFSHIYYGE